MSVCLRMRSNKLWHVTWVSLIFDISSGNVNSSSCWLLRWLSSYGLLTLFVHFSFYYLAPYLHNLLSCSVVVCPTCECPGQVRLQLLPAGLKSLLLKPMSTISIFPPCCWQIVEAVTSFRYLDFSRIPLIRCICFTRNCKWIWFLEISWFWLRCIPIH